MSGTPTSTWACVGSCPMFSCGCDEDVIPAPAAASCSSQAEALVGQWTVVTDQQAPHCDQMGSIGSNSITYVVSSCSEAATFNTQLLSATCGPGAFGGLSGMFSEEDDGGGTWDTTNIYCNYWQRSSSTSNLVWEWFGTTDQSAGCPSTLAEARAKPLNGDLWYAGSDMSGTPTSTWACVGSCPTLSCGCSGEVSKASSMAGPFCPGSPYIIHVLFLLAFSASLS
ncbi:unnamed protein product [Prorocentrum cordatum]|uniref:Cellulase n=1 Tax=Prorocentrum cordatum TaxID=2364126 RepID=A0ABN9TP37_9DINO|nr:unnamed protein product [Polarella glacialis]